MFNLYFAQKLKYFSLKFFGENDIQNYHAFLSNESLFTFSTFYDSSRFKKSVEFCLHILNKSLIANMGWVENTDFLA